MNYEAQALLNEAQEELNMENDGLTLIELQGYVGSVIDDSKVYIDDDISPNRATATEYFMGEPFGNEEAGSSTIVDMTVRDTVGKIMPALMRVFFSTENVVQFSARSEEDTIFAEMATDYVNYVLNNDNNLYLELQSAWQDALVRKTGIVKYWWDSNGEDESYEMTGITEEALIALQSDEELSIEILTSDETSQFFDVKVTHSTKNGRVRIKALPCEEFLIDRSATSLEDAIMTAHRSMLTVSELVERKKPPGLLSMSKST